MRLLVLETIYVMLQGRICRQRRVRFVLKLDASYSPADPDRIDEHRHTKAKISVSVLHNQNSGNSNGCYRWAGRRRREIPIADLAACVISTADGAADHVGLLGDHVSDQMSIFSAISMASSTSMPRYRTVLSIFVCPSKSCTALRLPVRR